MHTFIKCLGQFPRSLNFQLGDFSQCNCRSKRYIAHAGRAAAESDYSLEKSVVCPFNLDRPSSDTIVVYNFGRAYDIGNGHSLNNTS